MTIFSDNPHDRRIERFMTAIPNFKPRGVGVRFSESQVLIAITAATPTERNIGCFTFIEGATGYAEVGRFFTETEDRYILDLEMEDYFDYEGFGEYISDKFYGKFVCGGFIYNDTDTSLLDILYQDEPMTMGGM